MEEGPETSREHLGQVQTATKIGNKTSEGNSALDVAIEKARASIARRTRRSIYLERNINQDQLE